VDKLVLPKWLVAPVPLHEVNDRPGVQGLSGCMCELPFTIDFSEFDTCKADVVADRSVYVKRRHLIPKFNASCVTLGA